MDIKIFNLIIFNNLRIANSCEKIVDKTSIHVHPEHVELHGLTLKSTNVICSFQSKLELRKNNTFIIIGLI